MPEKQQQNSQGSASARSQHAGAQSGGGVMAMPQAANNILTNVWLWGFLALAAVAVGIIVYFNATSRSSDEEVKARILESLRAPTSAEQQVSEEEKARILESLRAPAETTGGATGATGGTTGTTGTTGGATVSDEEKSRILESLRAPR